MTAESTVDPNNFSRIAIALERWIKTGDVLIACIEKSGASTSPAHQQRIRALQQHAEKLRNTITQLKG